MARTRAADGRRPDRRRKQMMTDPDRISAADNLGWAMLAELTGCAEVFRALSPAPSEGPESTPPDGADR
jgi:hypothetical protein